jgi:hypothetical protein
MGVAKAATTDALHRNRKVLCCMKVLLLLLRFDRADHAPAAASYGGECHAVEAICGPDGK